MRKPNSASATRIALPLREARVLLLWILLARMRPASGPETPMWRCPATLVAAIFQPNVASPDNATTARCIAYPSARL